MGDEDSDYVFKEQRRCTPGERLIYALRQLWRLRRQNLLDVQPLDIDVERVAEIIGVANDIEFVADGPAGRSYHFPSEVLVVDDHDEFPWRLFDLDSWALMIEFMGGDEKEPGR